MPEYGTPSLKHWFYCFPTLVKLILPQMAWADKWETKTRKAASGADILNRSRRCWCIQKRKTQKHIPGPISTRSCSTVISGEKIELCFVITEIMLLSFQCCLLMHVLIILFQIVYYILVVAFVIPLMIIIFAYINVGVTLYKSVKEARYLREGSNRSNLYK